MTIDELLREARRGLTRLAPYEAAALLGTGEALLVDTRPAEQRSRDGEVPGAVVVDRNVLEWRLDPASPDRLPQADSHDRLVVVLCDEGYSSSLAAATLRRLGLHRATDVTGGFRAWRACGLPVVPPAAEG